MRFRDIFLLLCILGLAFWVGWFGSSGFHSALFESREINRDDAQREASTLLSPERWIEFQIGRGTNKFRLLTNAGLKSTDAPDYDLSNPRLGWRYAIEYELLDSSRNLISKSTYHFRSEIRQLWDTDSEQAIYPIFFGKNSLVATQTRAMQIPVKGKTRQVAILRARLLSADPQIQEVVVRALAQMERLEYGRNRTWNRLSEKRRESISKYCVYSHELLNGAERTSLLRWQWTRCPMLGEFEKRYLFFIGGEEHQEIREQQIPFGLYADSDTHATIPVPEGKALVRLELTRLDGRNRLSSVRVGTFGLGTENRTIRRYPIAQDISTVEVPVDGGILEITAATRLVVRAFWQPLDALACQTANDWETHSQHLLNEADNEFEITPRAPAVRTYLSNQTPVEYAISHFQNQPTPLRLQLRYPLGVLFDNENTDAQTVPASSVGSDNSTSLAVARWQFESNDGSIIDSGILKISPQASAYDWLTTNGMRALVSDANNYFFSIPADVSSFKLEAIDCQLLVNASVRPRDLQRTIRVPEDYHPFNRTQSLNRSWFGLNPRDHMTMIRENRSFTVATQVRPPEIDDDILSGNYQWFRFTPNGRWIGKQMLIPQIVERELCIRQQGIDSMYFEMPLGRPLRYRAFANRFQDDPLKPRLIFAGDQSPGQISILIDGQIARQSRILAHQGEMDLRGIDLPVTGRIEIRAQQPVRFFLSGIELEDADQYLKRTAQRLQDGLLEFEYRKLTSQSELLTLRLYRGSSSSDRCRLGIKISHMQSRQATAQNPCPGWTAMDRLYDLRPLEETPSLILDDGQSVDTGHRCFIKLGEDLLPGDYKITVRLFDARADIYAILYQTIAGKAPFRNISVEKHGARQP